ncbi:MAG: CRISPR-associated endonuclease Cas1 [Treponema sp.]|nr:CRISPR-associated endonuclease Cas1 [Treponema sp.]
MGDVFILSDFGKLSKTGGHLLYTDFEDRVKPILPFKTEMIVLASSVSITGDVFQILSENGIPAFIVGRHGRRNVRLDYGQGKNVFLRQEQFRLLDDRKKSLRVAKSIVEGKIKNQMTFAMRIARTNSDFLGIESVVAQMRAILEKVGSCRSVKSVRGYEGTAAHLYFSVLDLNIRPKWAVFGTRSQRPPRTNVNAVLSFLYSLLTCKIQTALEAFGLDTMAGNLHELSYGKDALAYDIVEEFRTPFADTLCCHLFNHGMLCADDFRDEDGGIYLTENGAGIVASEFEKKLSEEISLTRLGISIPYKKIFLEQARHYRDFVLGTEAEYIPFSFK